MKKKLMTVFAFVAAALPALSMAQGSASYEPQQRLRTALDTCMADEVMKDAYCVRKCAPDFRLELAGKKALCIATKQGAKYDPPKPSYEKRPANPSAVPVPGA